MHLERADVSDSSGQQADESPESVATTMLSSTSKSLDAEVVQLSDDVPSLQWDTADLTPALLHHDLHACEYMQGGPKKRGHRLMTVVLSNLNRLKKITGKFFGKFVAPTAWANKSGATYSWPHLCQI